MEELEDLSGLKRRALQQLCKKYGIKANGKNVEMLLALEELRESRKCNATPWEDSSPTHTVELGDSQESEVTPTQPTTVPGGTENVHENDEAMDESSRGSNQTTPTQPTTTTEGAENVHENDETSCMDESSRDSNQTTPTQPARQRKRRATYSLSPPPEMQTDSSTNRPPPATPSEVCLRSPPRKGKRRATYSLSPPPEMQTDPSTNQPPLVTPSEVYLRSPPRKRKRRATYSLSPPSKRPSSTYSQSATAPSTPQVGPVQSISGVSEQSHTPDVEGRATQKSESAPAMETVCNENTDVHVVPGISDVHSDIMKLLEQRVKELKRDPNYKYKPVFSAAMGTKPSRIPVKSATAHFNKTHQRQFKRMTSIVDHQKQREERAAQLLRGPPPKRPRVSEREGDQRNSLSSKFTAARSTPALPPRRPPPAFTPSTAVLSVKKANFNFLQQRPANNKTPGTTLGKAGSHAPKEKGTTYKPHTGKLPVFNHSIY